MNPVFLGHLDELRRQIQAAGLYKRERLLSTAQGTHVTLADGQNLLNFCSNNYLGLSGHPEVIRAAHAALDRWGYGLSSVRFICGTQEIHCELESKLSAFLGTEATVLFPSCFDANGGVFETLLSEQDAVISDELNHASIIDGIRLCKARRFRYKNCDMADLEAQLRQTDGAAARFKLVVTDGVFSMDGTIAPLKAICDLADRYGALVMVDDSHAVGVMGKTGRGTPEHCGVAGRIDILTGTLGKALGGASGGYVSGHREIVDLLRQRSRPYLFSNTVAPVIAATSLKVLDLVSSSPALLGRLHDNARYLRTGLDQAGFNLKPGVHPIIPVMLGDAAVAQEFAARMVKKGIYVVGFSSPVVPPNAARIRIQVSAAHTRPDLDSAIAAFATVKREMAAVSSLPSSA